MKWPADAFGFNDNDLLLNRHGVVSPRQRVRLERDRRRQWRGRLVAWLGLAALLVLQLWRSSDVIDLGLLVVAGGILLYQLTAWQLVVQRDIPDQPCCIEGVARLSRGLPQAGRHHYLQIRSLDFPLDETQVHCFVSGYTYRITYLENPLVLLSYEEIDRLGDDVVDYVRVANRRLREVFSFSQLDIVQNRAARLGTHQRRRLWRQFWAVDGVAWWWGVVGALLLTMIDVHTRLSVLVVVGSGGLMLLLTKAPAARRLWHDCRAGLVQRLEGKVVTATTEGRGYLSIASKVFAVPESVTRALDPTLHYRMYYLPRSRLIISAEAGLPVVALDDADDASLWTYS